MSDIRCKFCSSIEYIKSGFVRKKQRYQCKECSRYFTMSPPQGKPAEMKALAVLLYSMGNATYGMIGKLLGVSKVAVYKWIKAAADSVSEPSPKSESGIVQIDEMWHFVDGKKTKFGFGEPMILYQGELWPGSWVAVMMKHAKS